MSDTPRFPFPDGLVPADPAPPSDLSAEIEDLLADPTVPIAEKQVRLQRLADVAGISLVEPGADADDASSPFALQVAEALALLAEGGHPGTVSEALGEAPTPGDEDADFSPPR